MWSADISRFLSVFFGSKLHELALGFDIGEDDGYAIEDSQNTGLDEHGSASPFFDCSGKSTKMSSKKRVFFCSFFLFRVKL